MIGTYYGNKITLGATAGDQTTDKDYIFAERVKDLLDYIYSDKRLGSRLINIGLEYKQWSKKQLLDKYLEMNYSLDDLITKSFSCYNPIDGKQCGRCKPCLRKFITLLQYEDTSRYYVNSPLNYIKSLIDNNTIWTDRNLNLLGRNIEGGESAEIIEKYFKISR